jgi:hypothetical protein
MHAMSFDISHLLEQWEYEPGQVVVRKFIGKDGHEKLQLRVDLGLLQMNAQGRPDGKRPFGYASIYDYYLSKLKQYRSKHSGSDDGFVLRAEDCARMQLEFLQYHHRYICFLQLEDYAGVTRDTNRNLEAMDLAEQYAESSEMAWSLQQFRPQVLMIRTRGLATQKLNAQNHKGAIRDVEEGLEAIRDFFQKNGRPDLQEQSSELQSLQNWLDELESNRPLSKREQLENDLDEAVKREDYEKAAQVRDELRNLSSSD